MISSLMFLKEKYNGKLKGCRCVNWKPQHAYIPKEDAASSTVLTMEVVTTEAMEALEGWDATIITLSGTFLHAKNDEEVFTKMQG